MGFAPIMGVMGLAGAGLSAIGSYESAEANSQAAAYQAQVARNNAILASQNASWTAASGAVKEANIGMQTRAQVGAMKAKIGAAGIDVNTGSSANVLASAHELGEMKQATEQSNVSKEAYGYMTQSQSDIAQAQLEEAQSHNYSQMAPIAGLGTFLSGASSTAGNWAKLQNVV